MNIHFSHQPRGYLTLLALVFGAIFVTVLGGLSGLLLTENYSENVTDARSQSLAISEAGLEYYKWHLAHFPTDLKNGGTASGPYTITYDDPVTQNPAGTYKLTITGNTSCGQLTSIDLTSQGQVLSGPPGSAVTLFARYALPTVALYSYILNSSVWAGASRTINGPYHSNGGIRMDGTANAQVTSSVSSWDCTSSFGCSIDTNEPGVFGAGPNQNLWSYPSPTIDFTSIATNFSTLKTDAQNSGLYLPRQSSGTSGVNAWKGYHLVFNSNGTVTIYVVTNETNVPSIPVDNSSVTVPQPDYTLIQSQTLYTGNPSKVPGGIYTLPASCGLIFVEDNTWIEGTIPSEVTVVAANVTTSGITPDIMLPNNITYSNASGVSGLTAISSNDILITPNSPQNMTLNGIFIAQGGAFGRNYYGENSSGTAYNCPNSYEPRTSLTITGTTVSNLRTGTEWLNGCPGYGSGNAGYQTRTDAFDQKLSTNPPPFTPDVSTTGQFVIWRQNQ